jgi:7,8-dihydro-6-hydroxymethylpterin dimethyltransferase
MTTDPKSHKSSAISGDELTLRAMCEECLRLVPAGIFEIRGKVFCRKACPYHGAFLTLLSTDAEYYRWTQRVAASNPYVSNTSTVIIELLDKCNMRCPTCIAGSSPDAGNVRTLDALANRLQWIENLSPMPQQVMLSGGEPTIHPDIERFLVLLESHPFPHVILITNGMRVSEDKTFVQRLTRIPRLEVYLQFDSLRNDALLDIRGSALRHVRLRALENLREANVPVSLVCVVKRGVNESEVPELIDFARTFTNVRGITFQPLKFMGRTVGSDPAAHMITLSEVRQTILDGISGLKGRDLQPHPASPETICVGYLSRAGGRAVTEDVNQYFIQSKGLSPMGYVIPLFFPPNVHLQELRYDDLFRIGIVSYLDRFTFNSRAAASSLIAFAMDDNTLLSVDKRYVGQQSETLPLKLVAIEKPLRTDAEL